MGNIIMDVGPSRETQSIEGDSVLGGIINHFTSIKAGTIQVNPDNYFGIVDAIEFGNGRPIQSIMSGGMSEDSSGTILHPNLYNSYMRRLGDLLDSVLTDDDDALMYDNKNPEDIMTINQYIIASTSQIILRQLRAGGKLDGHWRGIMLRIIITNSAFFTDSDTDLIRGAFISSITDN